MYLQHWVILWQMLGFIFQHHGSQIHMESICSLEVSEKCEPQIIHISGPILAKPIVGDPPS